MDMFWVVIWLSGEAAFVMPGDENYHFEYANCMEIREQIEVDIQDGVVDIDGDLYVVSPQGDNLEWQPWEVTCEPDYIEIGELK